MISIELKLLALAAVIQAEGNPSSRIIGGYEIEIGEVPYTVAVVNSKTETLCGGTILSEKFVATAAHCIPIPSDNYILAGNSILREGQQIKAKKVIMHPDYKKFDHIVYNDYGLMVLEEPLVFSDKVKSIPMAQDSLPVGTMMLATGWGYYDKNINETSEVLRAVQLPIVEDDICRTLTNDEQHDSILCAGSFDQGKSVFRGDSGGPLVFNSTLYGISSFVVTEKVPNCPAGFARVTYGYDWFMKTMKENMFT